MNYSMVNVDLQILTTKQLLPWTNIAILIVSSMLYTVGVFPVIVYETHSVTYLYNYRKCNITVIALYYLAI